jgi:hypothetical protein
VASFTGGQKKLASAMRIDLDLLHEPIADAHVLRGGTLEKGTDGHEVVSGAAPHRNIAGRHWLFVVGGHDQVFATLALVGPVRLPRSTSGSHQASLMVPMKNARPSGSAPGNSKTTGPSTAVLPLKKM